MYAGHKIVLMVVKIIIFIYCGGKKAIFFFIYSQKLAETTLGLKEQET